MTTTPQSHAWTSLLSRLSAASGRWRSTTDWPAEPLQWLTEAGVMGWVIPTACGGSDVSACQLMEGYDQLATACLVTTFILTQRNGACQRIAAADEVDVIGAELLPPLARGELFATVGISHLSTSRQHLAQPAVAVRLSAGELRLTGEVPWVTGAAQADFIVTGGTCDDGRQVLIAVPRDAPGVACGPPVELLALSASGTASLHLDDVRLPARYRLAGPEIGIMRRGGGGTGSVATSALAVGVVERAVRMLEEEASRREPLREAARPLRGELEQLREDLLASLAPGAVDTPACSAESLRQRANALVLRATQAALTASKGAGFVQGHPAERAVREALFFLVWSCPQPVAAAALRQFACLVD